MDQGNYTGALNTRVPSGCVLPFTPLTGQSGGGGGGRASVMETCSPTDTQTDTMRRRKIRTETGNRE